MLPKLTFYYYFFLCVNLSHVCILLTEIMKICLGTFCLWQNSAGLALVLFCFPVTLVIALCSNKQAHIKASFVAIIFNLCEKTWCLQAVLLNKKANYLRCQWHSLRFFIFRINTLNADKCFCRGLFSFCLVFFELPKLNINAYEYMYKK